MIRYPTYSELIFINGMIVNAPDIMTGKKKVRDIDLLLAAEQRPQMSAFGEDAYPSLHDKAAALLHSLARNHPFTDGNKRTAAVGTLFLLTINGEKVVWDASEALTQILDVAEGRASWEPFAAWLKTEPILPALEPDADRDTLIIEQIIREQTWLLHELSER